MNSNKTSWAWKQKLPRADKYLLLALIDYANEQGFIRPLPIFQLTARTGFEPRQIRQVLGRLIAAGVVQWLDSDHYRLNLDNDAPSPSDHTPPKPVQVKVPIRESVVVYLKALFR